MELLTLWAAVRRRRWVLVESIAFFVLAGLVSALLLPKSYQSTAKVIVSSSDATSAVLADLGLQELASGLSGQSDEIANHIALATTRPVIDEVIWKLQLRDGDGELREADTLIIEGTVSSILAEPHVEVRQHQSTDIVLLTATSDDPELSRMMADTLAQVYIATTTDSSRSETRAAREFVEERLEIVQQEFDDALGEMADMQQKEQVIDLDSEVRQAVTRLSDLLLMSEENAGRISEIRAQIATLRGIHGREEGDFLSPATLLENPELARVREELHDLRLRRVTVLLEKTDRHPDVVAIDRQIEELQDELVDLLDEQHELDPSVLRLQVELAGLLDRAEAIDLAIERTTETFSKYPQKMRKLAQLELAANATEEVYRSLQSQSYQIAIAEAMAASPLQLVEPAMAADRPAHPRPLGSGVWGLLLGVVFGLGLVGFLEVVDDSVKGRSELRDAWKLPLLGLVPRFDARKLAKANSEAAEAFRTVVSALDYATLDKPARVLLISSCVPGEGKSTVAANLAASLAAEGHRTVLVDCDLRRPSVHSVFAETNNAVGLAEVLASKAPAPEALQTTGVENLSVLAAGARVPNPGRVAGGEGLAKLIALLAERFDRVVLDGPPVLVVNDGMLLAKRADHVVLVASSGETTRRSLGQAAELFAGHGLEPLGVVLNKADTDVGRYGDYYS